MTELNGHFGREALEIEHGYTPLSTLKEPDELPVVEAVEPVHDKPAVVERQAINPDDGKPLDDKVSLTIDEAAQSLASQRNQEAAVAAIEGMAQDREAIDAARAEVIGEQPAETADPKADQEAAPEEAPAVDGLDPELAKALQHPQVRQAIEQHFQQAEEARITYVNATAEAVQMATAGFLALYPELNGMTQAQAQGALALMRQQNPQRFNEITAHLQRVDQIRGQHQQAAAVEAQRAQQRFGQWAVEQDRAFETALKGVNQEERGKITQEVLETAQEYGVDRQTFMHLYATNPVVRAAPFQRMMADAARYRMAKRSAAESKGPERVVPPVVRPGAAGAHVSAVERSARASVSAADRDFEANPTAKNAARALAARRAARR